MVLNESTSTRLHSPDKEVPQVGKLTVSNILNYPDKHRESNSLLNIMSPVSFVSASCLLQPLGGRRSRGLQ